MLIRYGYEITLACQQPTALVCLLSVHEDRAADIRVPETTFHSVMDNPLSERRVTAPIPVIAITIKAQKNSQRDTIRGCGMMNTFQSRLLIIYTGA